MGARNSSILQKGANRVFTMSSVKSVGLDSAAVGLGETPEKHCKRSEDPYVSRTEMVSKRSEYLGWDDYFMAVACLSAQRSKDPSTQVHNTGVRAIKEEAVGADKSILVQYPAFVGCDHFVKNHFVKCHFVKTTLSNNHFVKRPLCQITTLSKTRISRKPTHTPTNRPPQRRSTSPLRRDLVYERWMQLNSFHALKDFPEVDSKMRSVSLPSPHRQLPFSEEGYKSTSWRISSPSIRL